MRFKRSEESHPFPRSVSAPGSNTEVEREHFDRISDEFDHRYNVYGTQVGRMRVSMRMDRLSECLAKVKLEGTETPRVLEIGCGTGEYTLACQEWIRSLFALDLSFSMIRMARKKTKAHFLQADAIRIPCLEDRFDLIFGNATLHHVPLLPVMKEIRRVMKPGARAIFFEPNMMNPHVWLQKNVRWFRAWSGDSERETAFLRWRMIKVLKEQGWREIYIEPFDFLHPWTPDRWSKRMRQFSDFLARIPLVKEVGGSLWIELVK